MQTPTTTMRALGGAPSMIFNEVGARGPHESLGTGHLKLRDRLVVLGLSGPDRCLGSSQRRECVHGSARHTEDNRCQRDAEQAYGRYPIERPGKLRHGGEGRNCKLDGSVQPGYCRTIAAAPSSAAKCPLRMPR